MQTAENPSSPGSLAPPAGRTEVAWLHVACGLVGLALAAYSWYLHVLIAAGGDSGCGISESISCDKVIGSKPWGAPFGVPLGIFGMAYFAIVLLTAVAKREERVSAAWQRLAVAGVGLVFSLGLEYVMWVILRHGCPVCMLTHGVTLINLGFALTGLFRAQGKGTPLPREGASLPAG